MKNVRLAFEVWEKDISQIPPSYQQIKCLMVFDVKMGENFHRKAQFVVGGHTTEAPLTLTYLSIVSRDSVRIILLVVALNGLNIMACDIQNAYLMADCREKIWTIARPEFGSEKGTPMVIRKALYGLKSSGAAFRAHLAETLYDIGFRSSKADPDAWLRPAVKPNDQSYYEYILCYVGDILSVSLNATSILKSIQVNFKLKDDKIEPPSDYLSAVLGQMDIDGKTGWYLSSEKYVKSAIENVEQILPKGGQKLPSKCRTPLSSSYRPELDTSPELKEDGLQRYQELIGVLRWAFELGRVDILLETSMMSTHLALTQHRHLEQLYHMLGYWKANPKRKLYLDPQDPQVDEWSFQSYDWYDFYQDAEEAVPGDMPLP